MTHDWSPRTFRIGIAASFTVLLLQLGGVPVLETLNPLSVTGCATPKMTYIRAPAEGHVSADVDESPVRLVDRGGNLVQIPATYDHPILLTNASGTHGPLLLQGIDHERQELCGWREGGTTACFPIADIREVRVIHQGNLQKDRRMGTAIGAVVGGLAGFSVPFVENSNNVPLALCLSLATTPVGALMGAGVGTGMGGISGSLRDRPDRYRIAPTSWQFQSTGSPEPKQD